MTTTLKVPKGGSLWAEEDVPQDGPDAAPLTAPEPAAPAEPDAIEQDLQQSVAPAPEPQAPTTLFGQLEQDDAKQNAVVSMLFKAGAGKDVQRQAGIINLSKLTGVAPDLVEQNYDEFLKSAEAAKQDPQKWREENPALLSLLLERPELAPVMMRDQQLSNFTKAMRAWDKFSKFNDQLTVLGSTPDEIRANLEARNAEWAKHPEEIPRPPTADEYFPEEKGQVPMVNAPGAYATGLDRLGIYKAAWEYNAKQMDLSKLGFEIMMLRNKGLKPMQPVEGELRVDPGQRWSEELYTAEKKALAMQQDLQFSPFYNAGPLEQVLLDGMELLPSQWETLKGGGAGGAAGAVAIGLATRSWTGAKLGWRFGKGIGAFYSSARLEAGGAYLEMRDAKTDEGKPVTEAAAAGAAAIYGLSAAIVEVAQFDSTLKMLGPLGDALAKGEGKTFLKAMLKNPKTRHILEDAGKRWIEGAASEAGEEWVQEVMQGVADYFAKENSSDQSQKFDWEKIKQSANEVAAKTFTGTLAFGAGASSFGIATQLWAKARAENAAKRVAPIIDVAKSPSAQAAPEAVAQLIEQETARTGESVTHLYVDPGAFTRLFQDGGADPEDAARELMGEEGPAKVREAMATGQKIEIPVADYLSKWGATEAAQALAGDTTAAFEGKTSNELAAQDRVLTEEAKALVARFEKEAIPAESEAEQSMLDALESRLARSPRMDQRKAAQAVALWRSMARVTAKRFGIHQDELFKDYTVKLATEAERAAEGQQPGTKALAQGGFLSAAEEVAWKNFQESSPEVQASDVFSDHTTNLFNRPGFEALPAPSDRRILVDYQREGVKIRNDQHNHLAVDGDLVQMGKVLREHGIHDSARVGTRVIAWVATLQQARDIATAMESADKRMRVTFQTMENQGAPVAEMVKALDAKHSDYRKVETKEGRLGHRKGVPLAFEDQTRKVYWDAGKPLEQWTPEDVAQFGEHPKSAFADSVRNAAGTALKEFSDKAKEALKNKPDRPALSEEHRALYKAMDPLQAFNTMYRYGKESGGLLTGDGAIMAERENHQTYQVSIDGRGVGDIVKLLGGKAADHYTAEFNRLMAGVLGWQHDPARQHETGDEWWAHGPDDVELGKRLDRLQEEARNILFFLKKEGGSTTYIVRGVHFARGIGKTFDDAEVELGKHKAQQDDAAARDPAGPRFRIEELDDAAADKVLEEHSRRGLRFFDLGRRDDRQGGSGSGGASQSQGGGPAAGAQGEIAGGTKTLFSGDKSSARGWFDRIQEGTQSVLSIFLSKKADRSTFVHETAHAWMEMMGDLAERSDAPAQFKADWEKVLKFLEAPSRSDLTREQKEKFARSFEAYLFEGQAPSAGLEEAFAQLSKWIKQIYRALANLNAPLDDEIRGVFDRLLATDEEIDRKKRAMGLQPMWRSPEEAGMTPEQWRDYLDSQAKATSHAASQARLSQTRAELKATKQLLAEAGKQATEDAESEFERLPAWRAWRLLRLGEVRGPKNEEPIKIDLGPLDRTAVEMAVGPTAARSFRTSKDGASPDEIAALLVDEKGGALFTSGADMLQQIVKLPSREEWVNQRAGELVKERHPEQLDEKARLEEAVAKGLHGEATSRWLLMEWRALRSKSAAGPGGAPIEAIKRAAEMLAAKRAVGNINSYQALVGERKAANEAMVFAAKGDFAAAYVAKQQQILNHYLWVQLEKAREDRESFLRLANELSDDKARGRLGLAAHELRDVSDSILEALGLKEKEQDPGVLAERKGLDDLVTLLDDTGVSPAFDRDLLNKLLIVQPSWKTLALSDMREVHRALAQVRQVARNANSVRIGDQRLSIEEAAKSISSYAEKEKDLGPEPASESLAGPAYQKKLRRQGRRAAMLEPKQMFERLGTMAVEFFWHGYMDAKHAEEALASNVLEYFEKNWDELPAELQKRRYEIVADAERELPTPSDVNRSGPVDRQWVWMVALNMGNQSNRERLLGGYDWKEEQVLHFLGKTLTDEEWTFIEKTWQLLDKELYPAVAKHYEEINGVRPDKIQATPIKLPSGRVVSGGYFPARYDPVSSRVGQGQSEKAFARMNSGGAARASVAKGFTKARAEHYSDVINLQWGTVPAHVLEVIHYTTHDQFVRQASRVLYNDTMRRTIQRRLGAKYQPQLESWLKVVAGADVDPVAPQLADYLEQFGALKNRFVYATLGYSLTVAAGDLANPMVAMANGTVKARHLTPVLAKALNPLAWMKMRKEGLAKSPELRSRAKSSIAYLKDNLQKIGKSGNRSGKERALDVVRKHAFFFMEMTDRLTSTVIWTGAFEQAKAEGLSESDAVRQADMRLQDNMPSNALAEQPAMLRDKRTVGALTAFIGYFSKLYNMEARLWHEPLNQWDTAENKKQKWDAATNILRAGARTMAIFFAAAVLGEVLSGRGPEDDESWAEYLLRKFLAFPGSLVPVFGAAWEGAVNAGVAKLIHGKVKKRKFSMRNAPAAAAVERIYEAIDKAVSSGQAWDRVAALLEALALWQNVPGVNQASRTLGYFAGGEANRDLSAGNVSHLLSGPVYGERKKQPTTPFLLNRPKMLP